MRFAIHRERTGPANSFATIGIERNRFFAAQQELLIYDVEHFEERSIWRNIGRLVVDETTLRLSIFLPPDLEFEVHL